MANTTNPTLSKRNALWLAATIAAAVIGGVLLGLPLGLIAPAGVLVISEIVERSARRKRRQSELTNVDA